MQISSRLTMATHILACIDTFKDDHKLTSDFLTEALESGKKICLFEVGVGFNTPTIIRFPFEKLAKEHEEASLVRLNLEEAVVPESLGARAVGFNEDMKKSMEYLRRIL
jgi:hypothetical protein